MASTRSVQKELESLRKEIAGLRDDYARLKSRAKATKADGTGRVSAIRDDVIDTIDAIRAKVANDTEAAADEISEALHDLRGVVSDYTENAEKTVATHPLATIAGAVALGFLIGRFGR